MVQKGWTNGAQGSSPKGRETAAQRYEDGTVAVVQSAGMDMSPRREGKELTGCSGVLAREDGRGKKTGRCGEDGAPFIGDAVGVGDEPRAVPHGGKAWGRGASVAVGR
jgi:hypothetical protein